MAALSKGTESAHRSGAGCRRRLRCSWRRSLRLQHVHKPVHDQLAQLVVSRQLHTVAGMPLTFTITTMKPVPAICISFKVAASSLRTCIRKVHRLQGRRPGRVWNGVAILEGRGRCSDGIAVNSRHLAVEDERHALFRKSRPSRLLDLTLHLTDLRLRWQPVGTVASYCVTPHVEGSSAHNRRGGLARLACEDIIGIHCFELRTVAVSGRSSEKESPFTVLNCTMAPPCPDAYLPRCNESAFSAMPRIYHEGNRKVTTDPLAAL